MTNALKIGCGKLIVKDNWGDVICGNDNIIPEGALCPSCQRAKDVLDEVRKKIDLQIKGLTIKAKRKVDGGDKQKKLYGIIEELVKLKELLTAQDKTEVKEVCEACGPTTKDVWCKKHKPIHEEFMKIADETDSGGKNG